MMHLITGVGSTGGAIGGWRHKRAWRDTMMNLDHYIEAAKVAERGKFDAIFFADGNGVRQMDKPLLFEAMTPSDRPSVFEPVTVLTALSQHTSKIGLVSTATTTYEEPYTLARKFGSLDHISKGRAGWNIVTTSMPEDSKNFGHEEHMAREDRYPRAMEFIDVCKGLWDSWADDAFIQDIETGRYLDHTRVHALNHKGKYLSVQGPLNMARPPQGYPVLFTAGQSEDGKELAAKHADCVFAAAPTKQAGMRLSADIKGRMDKYGRRPEHLKIFPAAAVFVGRTAEEADDLYAEVMDLIPPAVGVAYLSKQLQMDLKGYDLDGPVPDLTPGEPGAIASFRDATFAEIREYGYTIRQAYQRIVTALGAHVYKGTAKQIADEMEDWYTSGACDGFMVAPPVAPFGLVDFVDLVIPELQRRGLFRTEYEGSTTRERMGLPISPNQFFSPRRQAAE